MKIAEVSEKFGLTADTLRYYEKIGLMKEVEKDASGRRDYQEQDLKRINFLKCMRLAGISIESLKKYVDLYNLGEYTIPQRKQILINQQEILEEKMAEMQKTLDYLKYKIDNYEEVLVKKERKLAKKS